jgi:hypothetical protein
MLTRGYTLTKGNQFIWHTTPGAFVFQPAFIVASFLSFVKHPFPEQFSWFATYVQRNPPSFDRPFHSRFFITHLFNRIPSHTICLSLCSYSAQSQSRLGLHPCCLITRRVQQLTLAVLSQTTNRATSVLLLPATTA